MSFCFVFFSLGWPVKVKDHAGWTGHIDTSYNPTVSSEVDPDFHESFDAKSLSQTNVEVEEHGGALYNGDTHILYWADASSEIAFIVPTDKDEDNIEINESNIKSDVDGNCPSHCSMGSANSSSSWDVSNNPGPGHWYERSVSESNSQSSTNVAAPTVNAKTSVADKPRTLSLDFEKHSPNSSFSSVGK